METFVKVNDRPYTIKPIHAVREIRSIMSTVTSEMCMPTPFRSCLWTIDVRTAEHIIASNIHRSSSPDFRFTIARVTKRRKTTTAAIVVTAIDAVSTSSPREDAIACWSSMKVAWYEGIKDQFELIMFSFKLRLQRLPLPEYCPALLAIEWHLQ